MLIDQLPFSKGSMENSKEKGKKKMQSLLLQNFCCSNLLERNKPKACLCSEQISSGPTGFAPNTLLKVSEFSGLYPQPKIQTFTVLPETRILQVRLWGAGGGGAGGSTLVQAVA